MNWEILQEFWHVGLSGVAIMGAVSVTAHVLIFKRSDSAIAWIGLAWLSPLIGVVLYLVLGINRIQRRAKALRNGGLKYQTVDEMVPLPHADVLDRLDENPHLASLERLVSSESPHPVTKGNQVTPLICGDEAYPAMLLAIDEAQTSITLVTYIFDNDTWGKRFAEHLAAAHQRGVEVRVLIDSAGLGYSFPSIFGTLKKSGIQVAKFLPAKLFPPRLRTINLRNHRKIMVVDGVIGFTGGMNIRASCVIEEEPKHPTRDTHFRLEGPVVAHLQRVFADDWMFSTQEQLNGTHFFPTVPESNGDVLARGIADGPDENIDHLRWAILGAVSVAERSIRIVTPYFLPDAALIDALIVARKRGIEVDIIIPLVSNLPYVDWASMDKLGRLLQRGVRVFRVGGEFDHSKLMVVDGAWTLLGSANIDPRSLVLNFEFNVECYSEEFGQQMDAWIVSRRELGTRFRWEEWANLGFGVRLRNGFFRLFAPYL